MNYRLPPSPLPLTRPLFVPLHLHSVSLLAQRRVFCIRRPSHTARRVPHSSPASRTTIDFCEPFFRSSTRTRNFQSTLSSGTSIRTTSVLTDTVRPSPKQPDRPSRLIKFFPRRACLHRHHAAGRLPFLPRYRGDLRISIFNSSSPGLLGWFLHLDCF